MYPRLVDELPDDLPLLPWAEEQMRRLPEVERKIFIRRTEKMWVLETESKETLMVVGMRQLTQSSVPELWVLLCTPFTHNLRRNMILIRHELEKLLDEHPRLYARVDAQTPNGIKFVQAFGFREIRRDTHAEREYIYCEVTK